MHEPPPTAHQCTTSDNTDVQDSKTQVTAAVELRKTSNAESLKTVQAKRYTTASPTCETAQ